MYEEDAISLGDVNEPIAHEPFTDDEFDEIDAMVLDHYNAMSMAMGTEASLFRQVPSAHVLTDTDMLPLHVRFMPSLYIASSNYNLSCCVPSSNAYSFLCSHEINDACCAGCKGKMADGSELSGAFWLLDSGASHHFTSDIGNFASYNELKRVHYAKTANGVALIAGIGTVLLQCLDHKSFPVTLYQKFKYVITFYDDYTSHAWTMPLHSKAAAITAAKDFLKMVHVQHDVHIVGWMSDAGGEYKSDLFDQALLEKGIKIYQSAPRTPMQNGCAECLGHTLMDKAESMQHQACIPDSWWEFAFAHATHIYNRTPVACLRWCTPHEMLKGEMPNINHLCVFGCGAFVYLPAMARANKMAPKSELMTYVGVAPGNEHKFLFMRSTNAVFTAAHAIFDKHHFPCCPKNRHEPLENPFGRANPKPATD